MLYYFFDTKGNYLGNTTISVPYGSQFFVWKNKVDKLQGGDWGYGWRTGYGNIEVKWTGFSQKVPEKAKNFLRTHVGKVTAQLDKSSKAGGAPIGYNPENRSPLSPEWHTNSRYHRLLKVKSPYMRGEDVRAAQRGVGVTADGIYGPATSRAVKSFQSGRSWLTNDGVVGACTAHAIGMAGGKDCKPKQQPVNRSRSSGSGSSSSGGGAKPTPKKPKPKPKPKPPKPGYKLPTQTFRSTADVETSPFSAYDIQWATYDVFNAYELANILHNRYFETIVPQYSPLTLLRESLTEISNTNRLYELFNPDTVKTRQRDTLDLIGYGNSMGDAAGSERNILYFALDFTDQFENKPFGSFNTRYISRATEYVIDGSIFDVSLIRHRIRNIGDVYTYIHQWNFSIDDVGTTTFTFSWSQHPYATEYLVNNLTTGETTTITSPTTTTFTKTNATPDTAYTYTVTAIGKNALNEVVLSETSPELLIKTNPITIPSAVSISNVRASDGYVKMTISTTDPKVSYIKVAIRSDRYPTSPTDGQWNFTLLASQLGAKQFGPKLATGYLGTRSAQSRYVKIWTYNSTGGMASTVRSANVFFKQNPIDMYPTGRNAYGLLYGWESKNRVRVSNYGSSNFFRGQWYYGTKIGSEVAGRNVTYAELRVYRADGGSGSAIPVYLGTHNNTSRPSGKPSILNVKSTVETVARYSNKWINLGRWNGSSLGWIKNNQIKGFGMRKDGPSTTDSHTWVGQSGIASDGLLRVWHADFS